MLGRRRKLGSGMIGRMIIKKGLEIVMEDDI